MASLSRPCDGAAWCEPAGGIGPSDPSGALIRPRCACLLGETLLADSGEDSAAALAGRFGTDLRSPEFWQAGLRIIDERVEQYLAL